MVRRKRKGTTQEQRINPQLLHSNFTIDDRTFEDLIGYIATYLDYINFYNTRNKVDGSWKTLVEKDPIIYMVTLIKEPITDLNTEASTEDKEKALQRWNVKATQWYHKLIALDEEILAYKIETIATHTFQDSEKEQSTYSDRKVGSQQEHELNQLVITSRELIANIQNFVREHLRNRIFSQNTHQPQNALYIAFVLLYDTLQKSLNTITQRHLDFYYRDVLQQTSDPGIPTTAVVCFEVTKETKSDMVLQGTELSAGKLFGSQQEVRFTTDRAISVSPIQITSLRTLYCNKNPFIQIGTQETTISSISENILIHKGKAVQGTVNRALFGADEEVLTTAGINPNTTTSVGFMIGSPVLFLEEGLRNIEITLVLEADSSQQIFWKLLHEMADHQKLPIDVVSQMVLEQTFRVSYTTLKGWETIPSYRITPNEEAHTLNLAFTLEKDAAPVTPLATAPSPWPMVKVLFDPLAPIYSYSFFKGVKLQSVTLDVNVKGIKNLTLHNTVGGIEPGKPFSLFSPIPTVGDYLAIGKSELFKKKLTQLDIHLEWNPIPEVYGGFDTYYQDYDEVFTNDSFTVTLAALSNGYWLPQTPQPSTTTSLFTTVPHITPEGYETVVLSKTSTISISDFAPFALRENYNLQDPLKYDVSTLSGFLKLSLATPSYAFGHELYKKNYADRVAYNTKHKDPLPLPNPPFTPKVKSITLDYTAKAVLHLNDAVAGSDTAEKGTGEYFHITPFGIHQTVYNHQVHEDTLVHDFQGEGYLYMELTGVDAGGYIALFFDLHNANPLHSEHPNNMMLHYKEGDYWVRLRGKHLLSDSTHQLTRSGIVELALPPLPQSSVENTYTLRFTAKREAYTYPTLLGIYPNAVTATCTSDDSAVIGKTVAAYSITKVHEKLPGIKKVLQPAASYGGKIPTPAALFYTAASERLRHKDRAVTFWDYEHLLLQSFHELAAVKCTNLDAHFNPQAGQVTLVVLSTRWNCTEPHYFNRNELDQMTHFLQQRANAFVQIQVRNPSVEWLVVNCVVSFYQGDSGGHYMDDLNAFINQFLCPMSGDNDKDEAGIGAAIIPGRLATHIGNLPYVKFVEKLNIEHIVRNGIDNYTLNVYKGPQKIKPTKPWSILVPKSNHKIFLPSVLETESMQEITTENLQIGIDYIIAGDEEEEKPEPTEQETEQEQPPEQTGTTPLGPTKADTILTFKI